MRHLTRLVVPALTAVLLAGVLATVALAWNSTCGSGEMCVYRDRDLGLPLAAQTGSNAKYGTAKYPNSSSNINDSASSLKNLYSNRDVTWHHEPNQGGAGFCVDSNVVVLWVGLFSNDAFSSHQLAGDDSAC